MKRFVSVVLSVVFLLTGLVSLSNAGQSAKRHPVYQTTKPSTEQVAARTEGLMSFVGHEDMATVRSIVPNAAATKLVFGSYSDESLYFAADTNGDGAIEGFWKVASNVGFPVEIKTFGDGEIAVAEYNHRLSTVQLKDPVSSKAGIGQRLKVPGGTDGLFLKNLKTIYGFGLEDNEVSPYRVKEGGIVNYDANRTMDTLGSIISAAETSDGYLWAVYLFEGLFRIPRDKNSGEYNFAARQHVYFSETLVALAVDENDNVFLAEPVFNPETYYQEGTRLIWIETKGGIINHKNVIHDNRLYMDFGSSVGFAATGGQVFAINAHSQIFRYGLNQFGFIAYPDPWASFPNYISGLAVVK